MKYLYSFIVLITAFSARAQQSHTPNLIVEAMPFMSINSNEFGGIHQKYLSQSTPLGVAGGIGALITPNEYLRFTTTVGVRYNKQSLFMDIDERRTTLDYSNLDMYWKLMFGYQVKTSAGSYLSFSGGFMTFFSLKNKGADKLFLTSPYTDPLTGEQLNYLKGIYEKNGYPNDPTNSGNFGPILVNIILSMGYETSHILPQNRRCGVALEFSTRLSTSNNRGILYKFDTQRNLNDVSAFIDNRTSLGLNFFVALF